MTEQWHNRIVEQRAVPVAELIDNPRNWRVHPKAQLDALAALLARYGEAKPLVVRAGTTRLIDGHARVDLARKQGQQHLIAVFVELTDAEEEEALALLDPLGALAGTDGEQWRRLRSDVEANGDGELLAALSPAPAPVVAPDAGFSLMGMDDPYDAPDDPETAPGGPRPLVLRYSPIEAQELMGMLARIADHERTSGPAETVLAILEHQSGAAR